MIIAAIITTTRDLRKTVIHSTEAELHRWEEQNCQSAEEIASIQAKIAEFDRKTNELENQYQYPRGSLKGLYLVIGTSTGLIRKLSQPEFRDLLTNPLYRFIIKIQQSGIVIRTTIHTRTKVCIWEHVNDDESIIKWPPPPPRLDLRTRED